jgi:sugar-specific transcriptional regulator TrmB
MTARKLSLKTGLKRGLAYKVLDQLVDMGLVEKNEKIAKVALFFPAHPSKIKEVLKKRQEEIVSAENALSGVMNQMVSTYNLISGKPNVQFFEGEKGIKEVLADSLNAQEEILSFADAESVQKFIPKINDWYVKERERLGVKKRILSIDNVWTRDFFAKLGVAVTNTRLMRADSTPFETVMQIYDNKISYITLNSREMIGVIIEDAPIAKMHRYIFESMWKNSSTIDSGLTQK